MAKSGTSGAATSSSLNVSAERVGAALGHFAARIDAWKQQRDEIADDLRKYMASAEAMLEGLGHKAEAEGEKAIAAVAHALEVVTQAAPSVTTAPAGTPGRRRGYKQTAEARRKMRLAWRRRKEAKADAEAVSQ